MLIFAAILCQDPGSPSHGSRTGDDVTFGKTVRYKCDRGYRMTGSKSRTCTASGTWTGNQPICTGKTA